MEGSHRGKVESKEIFYVELEDFVGEQIREHLQVLLEVF